MTRRHTLRINAIRLAIILGLLAVVEILPRAGLTSPTILAPTSSIFAALWTAISSGEVVPHLIRTLIEITVSLAFAIIIGIPLGILFWRIPRAGRIFEPYMVAMYATPLILMYPLLLAILGLGSNPVIFLSAILGTIPIALNTTIAFTGIREIMYKAARVFNCTRWQTYYKVLFPAATLLIFAGIRMGVVYTTIGVISMEFIMTDKGIGFLARFYYTYFKTPQMYAYVILVVLVAAIINTVVERLERRIRSEMA